MEKSDFIEFADRIFKLEDDKKEIAEEIKDSIAAFAENNGLDKKSIAKAVKEYKAYLKDKEEFCVIDSEVGNLVNSVIYSDLN